MASNNQQCGFSGSVVKVDSRPSSVQASWLSDCVARMIHFITCILGREGKKNNMRRAPPRPENSRGLASTLFSSEKEYCETVGGSGLFDSGWLMNDYLLFCFVFLLSYLYFEGWRNDDCICCFLLILTDGEANLWLRYIDWMRSNTKTIGKWD